MSKRGRPARTPTEDERKKVKELAEKAPIADIAVMLGRSIPNVRKYFSKELISGKQRNVPPAPERKITQAQRDKVTFYVGCQMAPEEVALVFDMTIVELEKYFPAELAKGKAKTRAKVLDQLSDQMDGGAIGATKLLEAITVGGGPAGESGAPAGSHVMGKKAAAAAAAAAAGASGGRFAPRPPPKIVVDNT